MKIKVEVEIFKDPKYCTSDKYPEKGCQYQYLDKCNLFNEFLTLDSPTFGVKQIVKCDECIKHFKQAVL